MADLAGQFGTGMPTADQVMAQPGYQFGLNQGTGAINGAAAAAGSLYSGAQLRAAAKYGTDYATTKYDNTFGNMQSAENNQFNRQASIAGQGQLNAQLDANANQHYGDMTGAIGMSNANAQGASTIAQWNQAGKAFNSVDWGKVGKNVGGWFGGGGDGTVGGSNVNPDGSPRQNYADGGPVQLDANGVPVVGSRSKVRTGGGGGLSPNALMVMLQQAQLAQQPQPQMLPQGMALLSSNPVTNPRAVLDAQMRQAGAFAGGGPVRGPGGPRTDSIDARLSNGEHVMDAHSVNALGDGDNAKGQQKLNKLRAMLHGGY